MAHNNPFEDGNPWSSNANGPRYGNAYDNDDRNPWTGGSVGTPNRMPSPSNYRTESNKTEYPSENDNAWDHTATSVAAPANAYQYSGTRFNANENSSFSGSNNAYTKTEISSANTPEPAGGKPRPPQEQVEAALPPKWDDARMNPSKLRLLLRTLQLVAAIGHLGFAAGASPTEK
ncbi:hypothetical protein BX666DRAFT_1267160 [Dichotomocladium elegans]|nr:hypothetical protein BX666DRAFT_1267160 [Dichotomocladium elegans]